MSTMHPVQIIIWLILFSPGRFEKNDKFYLRIQKEANENGFSYEKHEIITEDEYILSTFRMRKKNASVLPIPVLMVHGMYARCDVFMALGPKKSLPYVLAQRGFDVWLINTRGSTYSKKHRYLNSERDLKYWRFTWHEIGYYDVAANIDYILNATQSKQIFYIGHSQGGTTYYVLTTSRPEYNSKIRASVNLAPTVLRGRLDSILGEFSKYVHFLQNFFVRSRWYELFPNIEKYADMFCKFCGFSKQFKDFCALGIGIPVGRESGFIHRNRLERICKLAVGGGSIFQTIHYMQNLHSGQFRQYDFGPVQNLKVYKQKVPPSYNLTKSTPPTITFYAADDVLAPRETMESVLKEVPNGKGHLVKETLFTHFDFVMAEKASEIVYQPLYEYLLKFSKESTNFQIKEYTTSN